MRGGITGSRLPAYGRKIFLDERHYRLLLVAALRIALFTTVLGFRPEVLTLTFVTLAIGLLFPLCEDPPPLFFARSAFVCLGMTFSLCGLAPKSIYKLFIHLGPVSISGWTFFTVSIIGQHSLAFVWSFSPGISVTIKFPWNWFFSTI